MTQVERPTCSVNAYALGHLSKRAVAIIVEYCDSSSVIGGFKTLREKARRLWMKNVHRLKIRAKEKVRVAVIVVVERDSLDGIHVAVEARRFGYISKPPVTQIFKQNAVSKTHHQQVGTSIVVEVKPERSGGSVLVIVPLSDTGLLGHIGESEVSVIVIKMIL